MISAQIPLPPPHTATIIGGGGTEASTAMAEASGTTAQPPTPKGTQADLLAIAQWLDPDATSEQALEPLTLLLHGIATYFLIELQHAADTRTWKAEINRYETIAKSAHALRLALNNRASTGGLLGPLANLRAANPTVPAGANPIPSNIDTAYGVCWRWGLDAHPLWFVEQAARAAIKGLEGGASGPGAASLHTRLRGPPQASLAVACARLLHDLTRERPAISDTGKLADLVSRVWTFATGTDAPNNLGVHAKAAARKLRDELKPPATAAPAKGGNRR